MIDEIKLSDEQREALKGMVKETVNALYLIQAQKDHMKTISDRAKDELGIKPAKYNKLAKNVYADSCKKLNDEVTELLDLAEELGFYSHEPE